MKIATSKITLAVTGALVAWTAAFILVRVLTVDAPMPAPGDGEPFNAAELTPQAANETRSTSVPESDPAVRRSVSASVQKVDADPTNVPSAAIEVSVHEAGNGAPIAGAVVSCDGEPVAETDDGGHASFAAEASRTHTIRATAPGRCPGLVRTRPEPGATRIGAKLTLVQPATVRGLVRDPTGAPAQGADVVLQLQHAKHAPGRFRSVASVVEGLASGSRTSADTDGAFRFDGIGTEEGLWSAKIVVLHDGCARYESDLFDVKNGETVGPIVCDLGEGARIRGRTMVSGAGAAAIVFLAGIGDPVTTGDEGGYEFTHVSSGPVTLCATLVAHPWVRASIALEIQPGEERVLDITLDHAARIFAGMVTTPEGVPLEGVRVWCETAQFYDLQPVRYKTRTRPDGSYRLDVPVRTEETALAYTLRLERWDDDCAAVVDPGRETVDLVCAESAMVALTAVDGATGRPVTAFDPSWVPSSDPAADMTLLDYESGPAGHLVTAIPTGSGELILSVSGYQIRRIPLTTRPGDHLDLGPVYLDVTP